jgi:3-methyladenine DNA glycosylase Tag
MDECLVLLADLMCWPLHKVASLLLNGRQIERKVSKSKIVKNRQKSSKIVKNRQKSSKIVKK